MSSRFLSSLLPSRGANLRRYQGQDYLGHDTLFDPLQTEGGKAIAEWADQHLRPGMRIVEMGCGVGSLSCFVQKAGGSVCGLDIDPRAISMAQRNAALLQTSARFIVSDLWEWYEDEPADVVLVHPPMFPGQPESLLEHRNLAGPDFEYFDLLWSGIIEIIQGPRLVIFSQNLPEHLQDIAGHYGYYPFSVSESTTWFRPEIK
jgi:methylase of polypeptide subunit release factors